MASTCREVLKGFVDNVLVCIIDTDSAHTIIGFQACCIKHIGHGAHSLRRELLPLLEELAQLTWRCGMSIVLHCRSGTQAHDAAA